MANRKSNHRRNAAMASVVMVLLILLILAFIIGVVVFVIKEQKSGNTPSSSEITSSQEDKTSSSEASSELVSQIITSSGIASSVIPTDATPDEKICYLTFDDGPSKYTPQTLEILDRYNAKATFFVVGNAVNAYHTYLGDIVAKGHAVGLHSYCHEYDEIYCSEEAYFADLKKIDDLVYNWTGIRSKIMRFPGGSSNAVSKKYCAGIMTTLTKSVVEKGYYYFDWNADSGDATGNGVPVEKLIANVKNEAGGSRVCLLMHDTGAKGTTVEALPQIIEYFQSMGYKFLPLTENSAQCHHRVNN